MEDEYMNRVMIMIICSEGHKPILVKSIGKELIKEMRRINED